MARIVHVCPMYYPARGGVEQFFLRLSEHLVTLGHDVAVWTTDARVVRGFTSPAEPRFPAADERLNGVRVRRFPVRHLPAQRVVRTAAHVLPFGERWKCDTLRWTPWVPSMTRAAGRPDPPPDLVHAAGLPYSSLLFAGVRLAERSAAPLIISPFTHVPPPGGRLNRAYLSPLNLGLMSRADRLFVQTELESRTLSAAGLIDPPKTIVGLGVDPGECVGGNRQRFREAHKLKDDVVLVGHLGNKSRDKGTIDLIEASERLWRRNVPFVLVLAGSEMPAFTRRLAQARFSDRIVNLGQLSDDERKDFFAAIDVFALPSYVESFGLSPLEAALNGVPVVAYALGGPAAIFSDDVDALLPPPGELDTLAAALERLILERPERRRLGERGAAVAGTYSWSRALDRATEAYEALLRPPRRSAG
jgi:glycosyltransferase involved in cell wall biosynthesis